MTNTPNDDFKIQITRAFAQLYEAHPRTLLMGSDNLWDPPITTADPDYTQKAAISGGTLTWLHRNGIVDGNLTAYMNGGVMVAGAQLTARGYRLAQKQEQNAGGISLGQLAADTVASPSSPDATANFELIARRITED